MQNLKNKILLLSLGLVFWGTFAHAQYGNFSPKGLDSLIVETYYISNAADATAADLDASNAGYPVATGVLPAGSVTYRIYAALQPGYEFQAIYGNTPHPLKVSTSTNFYNNSGGGNTPTNWSRTAVKNTNSNILGLDSWFTVGGADSKDYGILKREDSSAWGTNLINVISGGVMQNTDPKAGIPLTTKDGYYYSGAAPANLAAPPTVTFVGLTTELNVFSDGSTVGNSFSTTNGSVACLSGTKGPTASNKVLLGQFTTNGQFCFQFNIQVGTPWGGTRTYVALNPSTTTDTTKIETQLPSLSGCYPIITGIKDPPLSNSSFKIYPNPAKDLLTLDITSHSKENTSYILFNIMGSEVQHKNLGLISEDHKENIDISELPPGVYFIQFTIDGVLSTKRFVKN
jgi:hypothetical protein